MPPDLLLPEMGRGWVLAVAVTIDPKSPPYLPIFLLLAALIAGVLIAQRIWRETHEDDVPATTDELLAEFQEAHASGELDDAEYRRVTELLTRPPASTVAPEASNPEESARVAAAPATPPEESAAG